MQITKKFVAAIVLTSISLHTFSEDYIPKPPRCEVPGMAGECHPGICYMIKMVNAANGQRKCGVLKDLAIDNVLLLEGPTGTGKTTSAQAIAENTNRHFVKIGCPDLLDKYIGGTVKSLRDNISNAITEGKNENKGVVILLDDVDVIANKQKSMEYDEYYKAFKALLLILDEYQNSTDVCFIFTTNHINRIPIEFKNRIAHIVSVPQPDPSQRKALLMSYSKAIIHKDLYEYCSHESINTLVQETERFSIRDIQELYPCAIQYASYENSTVSEIHLMTALQEMKKCVAKQNEPSEEELEKQRAKQIENERLQLQKKSVELQEKSADMQKLYSTIHLANLIASIARHF